MTPHPGRRRRWRFAVLVAVLLLCVAALHATVRSERESTPPSTVSPAAAVGERLGAVERWVSARRARVSLVFVDRASGERVGLGENEPILTASVAKLFIASQLAFLDATGQRPVSPEDDALLGLMLSASDDVAATILWDQMGGPEIVGPVAARYGLSGTAPPPDGLWWHTRTTASDVAGFYDQLLDQRTTGTSPAGAGRSPSWADRILDLLRHWSEIGADGYVQRFGLSTVFGPSELAALKQGWMCCVDAQWIHLTTGVFGPGGRYILVVQVAEDVQYTDGTVDLPQTSGSVDVDDESAAHARATVTGIVAALFPDGVPDGADQS